MIQAINNKQITFSGSIKKSKALNKSLDNFSAKDRLEFYRIREYAKKINDNKVFDAFEEIVKNGKTEVTRYIGLKELNSGEIITREKYRTIRKNGHTQEFIAVLNAPLKAILVPLKNIYKQPSDKV